MNLWQGLVLGLVQGLTEFLPVSSSGHLVLVEALTGVKLPGVFVEVSLHVATLGSVLAVYGGRLWGVARGIVQGRREDVRYALLLAVATIPAGIIGVLLHHQIEERFHSLTSVGVAFVVTGLVLWSTRWRVEDRTEPSLAGAVSIGAAQAVAILPGISRSGSTVSAALWAGLDPARAAEFSFLLAIPVIAGAALLEGRHMVVGLVTIGVVPFAASFLVAFVSGVWSIRFLTALLRRGRFHAFAPYCWAVGVFTILYAMWRA